MNNLGMEGHWIDPYLERVGKGGERIIKKHTKKYPVRVEDMAKELNIKISYEYISLKISGKIAKNKNGKSYCITVNKSHFPTRRRFTIAHELAHYFLHKGCIGDGIEEDVLYRSDGISSWQDIEANHFAAKLLMPLELIVKAQAKSSNLSDIAHALDVSRSALRIRLGIPD